MTTMRGTAADATPETLIGSLSGWFDSIRGDNGYAGPVSHWWRNSLRYCGVGLDWRYEGLIEGYLTLWRKTGAKSWLDRALRAGEDLTAGQLNTGNFRASAFERNPETAGTPHEATASTVLLRLARAIDDGNAGVDVNSQRYFSTAKKSLSWHERELWLSSDQSFTDSPGARSFVPNKIVSTAEAFFEWAQMTDQTDLIDSRVIPALEMVLDLQVSTGPAQGAIHQLGLPSGTRIRGDGKFFPLYIARCIPFLLRIDKYTPHDRFHEAAVAAGEFLARVRNPDGSFPAVVYRDSTQNTYPKWIAGTGDILRAIDALAEAGIDIDSEPTERWLVNGFDACGAFRTAEGFAKVHGTGSKISLYDVLHVAGWNDKAFRWLADRVEADPQPTGTSSVGLTTVRCRFRSEYGTFTENDSSVVFTPFGDSTPRYRWNKANRWAIVD